MKINGQAHLAAERSSIWEKLNDPALLQSCIPGCEQLERFEEDGYRVVVRISIGPVSARFKGRVKLTEISPLSFYSIVGEGEGGMAGFAKGTANVGLIDEHGGTLLTYEVEAQIGGKIAQLGQRLVIGSARKIADEFFSRFAKEVERAIPA